MAGLAPCCILAKNPKQVIGVNTARQTRTKPKATASRCERAFSLSGVLLRIALCATAASWRQQSCLHFCFAKIARFGLLRVRMQLTAAPPRKLHEPSDGFGRKMSSTRLKKEVFAKQRLRKTVTYCDVVAGEGFEPTTFGL